MKLSGLLLSIVSLVALSAAPSTAESAALPESGTYFIISASADQAMQPAGSSAGQSVLLYEFNQSGSQKWTVTRKIDPLTKKPTNRYTIRLAGENTDLYFQPHPVIERSAMISNGPSVFVLEAGEDGDMIKSVARNGDALFPIPNPPMNAELHFGASDGSAKFRWKFVPTN